MRRSIVSVFPKSGGGDTTISVYLSFMSFLPCLSLPILTNLQHAAITNPSVSHSSLSIPHRLPHPTPVFPSHQLTPPPQLPGPLSFLPDPSPSLPSASPLTPPFPPYTSRLLLSQSDSDTICLPGTSHITHISKRTNKGSEKTKRKPSPRRLSASRNVSMPYVSLPTPPTPLTDQIRNPNSGSTSYVTEPAPPPSPPHSKTTTSPRRLLPVNPELTLSRDGRRSSKGRRKRETGWISTSRPLRLPSSLKTRGSPESESERGTLMMLMELDERRGIRAAM